jgi:8-amino-7-oxononanoate synthase
MLEAEVRLRRSLEERSAAESLRSLSVGRNLIDFCSNDYLGFSRSKILKDRIREEELRHVEQYIGSTGSRLISGNSDYYESLERSIAAFHSAASGLIFNSGYDANLGVFSSVPQRNDIILYDQLVHASIRDGIRLSHARAFSFDHNDSEALERRLKLQIDEGSPSDAERSVYVAVESVYSMDGDCAPLAEMVEVCRRYGANLIVDEAHATGVFGTRGEGMVVELGLENEIFARVHTFGKALGSHGAIVLGSATLRSYLINFARSFIYTTALPFHSLAAIRSGYELLKESGEFVQALRANISSFKSRLGRDIMGRIIPSISAIQCIIVPGNPKVKAASRELKDAGFDVRPIMHPTVPGGSERIRICLHAFNTEKEIEDLTNKLKVLQL